MMQAETALLAGSRRARRYQAARFMRLAHFGRGVGPALA